jgi:hypothetical protein
MIIIIIIDVNSFLVGLTHFFVNICKIDSFRKDQIEELLGQID